MYTIQNTLKKLRHLTNILIQFLIAFFNFFFLDYIFFSIILAVWIFIDFDRI